CAGSRGLRPSIGTGAAIGHRQVTGAWRSGTSDGVQGRMRAGPGAEKVECADGKRRGAAYERYRPWRGWVEPGFWSALIAFNAAANSVLALIESNRYGLGYRTWEPILWEGSSAVLWLALLPLIVGFTRRFPFHWDTWRRQLPWHLAASVVVSVAHVLGMTALRSLVYRSQGMEYDFGPWPIEMAYEYLKDVRSYAVMVIAIGFYRLVLRRMQGEASLLAEPDEGPAVEPVERPERFLVRKLGREFLVAAADIEWLQAAGNYVNLRVRGRDYPLRSTISGVEAMLDPARFVRVHRSWIVNLDQVESIEPLDSGEARIRMRAGDVIPCSRRYRDDLRGLARHS